MPRKLADSSKLHFVIHIVKTEREAKEKGKGKWGGGQMWYGILSSLGEENRLQQTLHI